RSLPARRPRRRAAILGALAVTLALTVALGRGRRPSSTIEPERLQSFAPLPRPAIATDAASKARIELGRALFADPRRAKGQDVACGTCHPLDRWGVDGKKLSRESDGKDPPRNTLSVYNAAWFFALFWDGRRDNLVDQAREVLLSPQAMAAS